MSQINQFSGRVLSQGTRALAAYAANELMETRPEAKEGFGPDPFAGWQNWLAARIEDRNRAAGKPSGKPAKNKK